VANTGKQAEGVIWGRRGAPRPFLQCRRGGKISSTLYIIYTDYPSRPPEREKKINRKLKLIVFFDLQ
jgi:hypothetical protein